MQKKKKKCASYVAMCACPCVCLRVYKNMCVCDYLNVFVHLAVFDLCSFVKVSRREYFV